MQTNMKVTVISFAHFASRFYLIQLSVKSVTQPRAQIVLKGGRKQIAVAQCVGQRALNIKRCIDLSRRCWMHIDSSAPLSTVSITKPNNLKRLNPVKKKSILVN